MDNNSGTEKLLRAIFSSNTPDEECDMPEGWPDTHAEKAHYAQYAIIDALKYYAPALTGLKRLCDMYQASGRDGEGVLPNAITHHEVEGIQKNLLLIKSDIDDAFNTLMEVWEETQEAHNGQPD